MPYYRCPDCGRVCYSSAELSGSDECPTCLASLTERARLDPVPDDLAARRVRHAAEVTSS